MEHRRRLPPILALLPLVLLAPPKALADAVPAAERDNAAGGSGLSSARPVSSDAVSYSRDVLPILSERCFLCHGPDEASREADLRLDLREDATRERDGSHVIRPGDPAASQLIARVTTDDQDEIMPPPDSGRKPLSDQQIAVLRRWIEQGARWSEHWAFVAPRRPPLPRVKQADWIRNPIDAFVLRRLEREGIAPAREADRTTLLRRLSLDLIGLPPTIEETDAFLQDARDSAYQRQVDRLLASPHHGERWGRIWLDAARYADSDGFEKDKPRQVWFYRDWVINALNGDLPYDQFVIEQIAGDLLPHATQEQRVATGFLRNSMLNEEGGIDPEEFRMQAMFDRMDAIGKAILGLTIQCGQCHSHKYDPLSQRDYYRMFANLNDAHEAQPVVYTEEQQVRRQAILAEIGAIEDRLRAENPDWREAMERWEGRVRGQVADWKVLPIENASDNAQRYERLPDDSLLAQGYAPTKFDAPFTVTTDLPRLRAFRLEMLTHPTLPAGGPGRAVDGQFALTEFRVRARSVADPSKQVTAKFVRATADYSNPPKQLGPPYTDQQGASAGTIGPVEFAIDGDLATAWGVDAGPGRRNQSRKAVFVTEENIAFPGGTRLTITLVQRQGGWNSDDNQTLNLGRFRISACAEPVDADPLPAEVRAILAIAPGQRTGAQVRRLFRYWRTTVPQWDAANRQIEALWRQHPEGTTQLTYQSRQDGRQTYLLDRGDFLKPTEPVQPGVPGFLHPLAPRPGEPARLAFARWLVDRRSPTTARSIVNRVWQAYFGTGLVDTPEDLGSSGSRPSHPELLDWLAVELMDHQWSLKHLHRLIVTSSTYRQASRRRDDPTASAGAPAGTRDPNNRLLARGARFRVDAEVVRDIFLAASGLLDRRIGGPSVHPPAPAFLFQRPASYGPKTWNTEGGGAKYRRAIYTFRFRSVPYPALQAFDAPSGEFSTVRRPRSNTPLQALTTLNEPLFVQCAQALARRAVREGGGGEDGWLVHAFRCCLARRPTEQELDVLRQLLRQQTRRFEQPAAKPETIFGSELPVPAGARPAQLAALTVVSRALLNLDETITKE